MSTPKAETYCAVCHWQYCRHYGPNKECPTPDGLQAIELLHCFTTVPIHGAMKAVDADAEYPTPEDWRAEAVDAADAEEEPFDVYRAWRIQKYGIILIMNIAVLIAVLGGVYIGHFVWLP